MSDNFVDMKKTQLFTSSYFSPIGNLLIVAEETALLRIDFENENAQTRIERIAGDNEVVRMDILFPCLPTILQATKNWLDAYFEKRKLPPLPQIQFEDTPFRMLVWRLLLNVSYGQTISYRELAFLVAQEKGMTRMSAQAIGQAVGRNPISIIVPCHRVIGAKGELTGYAGGLTRKKFLLELEKRE